MNWLALIFPYRTHLEAEICWLQDQLAQKQRRCDELQEALVQIKQPSMKIQYDYKQRDHYNMQPLSSADRRLIVAVVIIAVVLVVWAAVWIGGKL